MASISEVSICNSGLIKIGAERITSLEQDTKAAKLCKERYPILRNEVLESHPWSFATKRVTLAQLAETPEFGWAYVYQLPTNYLRALQGDTELVEFAIEGNKLYTSESSFKLKYIFENTNPGTYTHQFAEAVAWRLAADLAYPIVNSNTLSKTMMDTFIEFLRNARFVNASSSTPQGPVVDQWIGSRF